MSRDEVQVVPEDLAGKAIQIRGLSLSPEAAQPALVSPDALATSGVALTNIAVNAEAIWAHQEFGRREGLRLAQTLDNVAAAYADVDRASGEDIDSTLGGPESRGVRHGVTYPGPVDLPAPPRPPSMPTPRGQLTSEQLLFPPGAQRALEAGDGGASLRAAARMWRGNAQSLAAAAQEFETNSLQWEGAAADAAYSAFTAYRDWLISLADAWRRLAVEADRMVEAHWTARRDNEPIAQAFEQLEREIAQHPASADNLRKTLQMAELQIQSEEIRNRYARDGQPRQIEPDDPPSPVLSGIPVTVDDHRRARRNRTHEPRSNPETGPRPADSGNSLSAGERPGPVGRQAASPIPATEETAQETPPVGAPGGGSAGAGQPAGGSAPAGRQSGTGMPVTPLGGPKLPVDPSTGPAASLGGGAGSGGSGARGAGGAPTPWLQPSVGAETVAPAPGTRPVLPAATAPGTAGGPGMAGGVGGMAPMMHGAKGDGMRDRKRNPQLSEDTGLYTEDRPWTEAVIGNRVRRRSAASDTKKESP